MRAFSDALEFPGSAAASRGGELSVVFGTFVVEYGQNNYADALEGSCGSARMLCARQVTRGVPGTELETWRGR